MQRAVLAIAFPVGLMLCGAVTSLGAVTDFRDPFPCEPDIIGCNDGNPCTDDQCDPISDRCIWIPDTSNACSDGNACTDDHCSAAGECIGVPDASNVCNDGNACTDDHCDESGACVAVFDATNPCDDSNVCTDGDACSSITQTCRGIGVAGRACPTGGVCVSAAQCNAAGECVKTFAEGNFCQFPAGPTQCSFGYGSCHFGVCTGPQPIECDPPGGCSTASCDTLHSTCGWTFPAGYLTEVHDLRFASDGETLTWTREVVTDPQECAPSFFTLVTGSLAALPVGSQPTNESCSVRTNKTYLLVSANPDAGQAFWYLIRGTDSYSLFGGMPQYRYGPLGEGRSTSCAN